MSLRDLYSILTTEVLVMFPAMTSNPGQPTLECQLQIRPPAVTCTPGFQHIPTMGFPSGAHNPQTTTPQKYLCNRAHTLWWNLPSHPQHGDKTSPLTSDTRPVWFTLVNLNFMQFHERKFHEIPLISVCYSQKIFPSSHIYFKPFIFKGRLDITWMSSCSWVGSSAREEECSILHNSVLDLSLGHQIPPPHTGALVPTKKEHNLKRNMESVSDTGRGNQGWESSVEAKPFMRYPKIFDSIFLMAKVRKTTTTKSSRGKIKHFHNCCHTVCRKAAQSFVLCSD